MPQPHFKEKMEEDEKIEAHQHLAAPFVYEVIRRQGEEELRRPAASLWWSGVAAGLAISTSVFCKGLLHMYLPDEAWRPIVTNFGYCVGFLIVILGSFQLFTEQTITAILPMLAQRTRRSIYRTARLWTIVLAANIVGTFFAAMLGMYVTFPKEQLAAFLEVSRHFADMTPQEIIARGILAGFFLGALVWALPSARGSEFWIIIVITYFIGLGDFSHVVAGSTEVFLLMLAGEVRPFNTITAFVIPAMIGNVIGGTALFSLIAYGQVRHEIEDQPQTTDHDARNIAQPASRKNRLDHQRWQGR